LEEPRRQVITNTSITGGAIGNVGVLPTQDMNHVQWPDIVANLRVDQAWGSAQIMGAIHQVSPGYYGTAAGSGGTGGAIGGHPNDKIGFAVGAGLRVNFPMIGPGDYLQTQVNYTQGALRYASLTPGGAAPPGVFGAPGELGLGFYADGVYCGTSATGVANAACPTGASSVNLTTVWSVQAAYEHFWTPSLRTSLVGAYNATSYNSNATSQLCGATTTNTGANTISFTNPALCSFDWSYWSVSSRTQWNITKDFYVGLEGYYGHLNTMAKGATVNYVGLAAGAQPTGVRTLNDQEVFVYRMRVHRDIVP